MQTRPLSWEKYVQVALSHAQFSKNDNGTWTVEIPVLPGCITWGETRAEAALMAEDAVQGWLITALRFGDTIPEIDGCVLGYAVSYPPRELASV